ncbi:hypothetical protein QFC19_006640 [Naganishia cerealis]|uniref:Uncharacterized protein n=1 Tax=Naganishia cerealis TaxID=610337 RepID=A0ACC2VFB4_9TREE|nr:hypothetical protein QFC19_006640 [Naganishia cerealis]
MFLPLTLLALLAARGGGAHGPTSGSRVALWQVRNAHHDHQARLSPQPQVPFAITAKERDPWTTEPPLSSKYAEHCFPQPLDHADPENNATFCQRYWVSLEHYTGDREGGEPVYLLDGGETSGANRLPFLETGILNILSNATSGIGIVLEHRYYGHSLPTVDESGNPFSLSTDHLRFLTSEQALLDTARFIQHLDLGALDRRLNGTTGSAHRPWIAYGGSYAGAMTAFLVTSFPHPSSSSDKNPHGLPLPPAHPAVTYANPAAPRPRVWGGIASSAVTHAQTSFPEYFTAIQQAAPDRCMRVLEATVEALDAALEFDGGRWASVVKRLFALEGLKRLASSDSDSFDALTTLPGSPLTVPAALINYAGYVRENIVTECPIGDDDAVHHFDEVCASSGSARAHKLTPSLLAQNGLLDSSKEPKRIRKVHEEEVEFVKSWLKEWKSRKEDGSL